MHPYRGDGKFRSQTAQVLDFPEQECPIFWNVCVSNVEDYYLLGSEVRTPQTFLWRHQIGHQLFCNLGVTVSNCNLSNHCSQSSYLFSLCSLFNYFPNILYYFSFLFLIACPFSYMHFPIFFFPIWTPSCLEIYLRCINFLFAVIFHNFIRFCTEVQGLQLLTWWEMQRCGRSKHH